MPTVLYYIIIIYDRFTQSFTYNNNIAYCLSAFGHNTCIADDGEKKNHLVTNGGYFNTV